ncbi:DNA-binding protein [Streptomyces sp. NPDC058257]|uniref:DNA-binding protein n=1 Tax=Streptomyces sp. NPDC058257 TaxID=3346409 RepID=UPI0036EB60FF
MTPRVVRTTERLLALDATSGATSAMPAVREAMRSIPELSAGPEALRSWSSDRLAGLAELCEVIGWVLFDAGFYREAHRMNARALALAELCGDRWTARFVLLNDSMLKAHTGAPRSALATAARASGTRVLPARVSSLVLIRQAHAIALLGGHREPIDLMARAQSRFLDGVSRHDPPWAWWIDQTELLGHQGWVLARLRQWDQAIPLLYEAVAAPGPSYRNLFAAQLLAALARAGAWREAEDLIAELAPRAARIGSVRTTRTLEGTASGLLDERRGPVIPVPLREAAVFLLESLPVPQGLSEGLSSAPSPVMP